MTVEAGECNGGRRGGDPKGAEGIGGNYVIVNGGGDHSSEEDLDHDVDRDHDPKEEKKKKSPDPSGAKEENGGGDVCEKDAVPEENGDGASAVERSDASVGAVAEMEAEEENGGADASSVERSGAGIESAVTNDAKEATEGVTEGNGEEGEPAPSAATTKKEDGRQVVEISAADVASKQEKGMEVDNGEVKATDDKETVVKEVHKDGSGEAETGSGSETIAESQQPELEIAADAETENPVQSEVEDVKESVAEVIVEVEDVKDSEPVIVSESVETAVVEESGNPELVESASEVEEVHSRQQPSRHQHEEIEEVQSRQQPEVVDEVQSRQQPEEVEEVQSRQQPEVVDEVQSRQQPGEVEEVQSRQQPAEVEEVQSRQQPEVVDEVQSRQQPGEVEEVQSRQQPEDPVNKELVPAAKVEGVHKDDSLEEETKSGSDMKVEVQEPVIVSIENEYRGESELFLKVEDAKESETEIRFNVNDVKESESVILLESVEPVVEETGNVVSESTAEVQPEDPVAEDYKVEVEVKESETGVRLEDSDVKGSESVIVPELVEPVVEETCNAEDYKVEVEDIKDSETGFRLEGSDVKEPQSVIVPESVEHLVEETCNAEEYKVEDVKELETGVRLEESDVNESESVIVPQSVEPVVEGTCNAKLLVSAAEVEVESRQQPEDPVAKDDDVEVEERKEPESVLQEAEAVAEDANIKVFVTEEDNREDPASVIEKADNITTNPDPEDPESVVSEADRVEVEQKEEPQSSGEALRTATTVEPADAVVIERSECFPIENEVAEMPNVESDAPTDEQSVQLEAKANYVSNDIVGVPTEKVDRSNNDECLECPKELLKEVARSIDDKHLELGSVNDGTTDQSETKPSYSAQFDEPISSGPVPRDAEPKTTDLQPTTYCELETEVSVEFVATIKGADDHVGGMESKSDNGSDSIEGGECKASSTEENRSTSKDDDEEPSDGQAATAETIQAPSEAHVVKRHPVYLIKVGRFIDDELEKKIQQAVLELNEKTRIRDSVQEEIRKKLVTLRQYDQELEDASAKENAQRAIFNEKHEELDGVQVLVNRINNATSIADIDEKIQTMVHRQQHETIDLKQEKYYIREINQLKRLREQLSLKKAPQEEIDKALAQRAEVYTRLEKLKKELKPLRDVLKSATNSNYELRKRNLAEREIVKRLREQYFVANRIRQEAYMQLQELRKQSAEKFKHFSMYKADQNIAANFRFSGDNEGLRTHCSRQVERIMELWNNNDDFRKDYIKSNVNSTLRRLGTLDGRSLGPGEEAPIVSPYMDRKPKSLSLPSSNAETSAPLVASGGKQEASALLVPSEGKQEKTEALATKQVTRTNHLVKSTVKAKSITNEVVPTTSISPEPQKDEKETKLEELAKKEEELQRKEEKSRKEMAAKEEEMRKEKAAAEMKEKLILEQKIKAKEAEERKRRKDEKARAKADYRSQKEAELKEKKRARKEMKRAYGTEAGNGDVDGQTTPVTDTASSDTSVPQEAETRVASTSKRRSSRPAAAVKQFDRVQPLPFPLRNRGKRKMTTWMWVILTALFVLLLFFAGNYVTVSSFSIPDIGF
ncbi:trichohyalin [Iris pallida]|uniref:Trichohyalin n=1 Tax=Iris pallida TaxID=29817 RepID=A0AAX6GXN9_IRIPA|nr:trichohyalin [Iris pallida]